MNYYEIAKERMRSDGDTQKAQEVVRLLDEMILSPLAAAQPNLYWAFRRAEHEIYNGKHFDEAYAKWQVSRLSHKSKDGTVTTGERWSIADVKPYFDQMRSYIGNYNIYDYYVALNAEWHDRIEQFTAWSDSKEKAENMVIESANKFYFEDDDAPEGKVWRYFQMMS